MCIPASLTTVPLNREVVHSHSQQVPVKFPASDSGGVEIVLPFVPHCPVWPRARPGSIQCFRPLVQGVALVSQPVAVTTRRRGTKGWVWTSFPLLFFTVVGHDFWRRYHFCDQKSGGNRMPPVGSTAILADGRILHTYKFFCHHTGRRPWELPGKKYTKNHLCLFRKYLMTSLVPICRERVVTLVNCHSLRPR